MSSKERNVLRVGVVQGGRLVEERLLDGCRVSIGSDPRSTLVLPWPSPAVPGRWRLFERCGRTYRVRLGAGMQGRVGHGTEVADLPAERTTALPPRARGKIAVGEVTILFQQVAARPRAAVRLPAPLRRSFARELDRPYAIAALFSFLLHAALVLYLRGVDWPRRPAIDEQPVRRLRIVGGPSYPPRLELLRVPATPGPAVAGAQRAPSRGPRVTDRAPRPPTDRDRVALVERARRSGYAQVVAALTEQQGRARDFLAYGSVDRDQQQALSEVQAVAAPEEDGRPLGRGAGPAGRVADVVDLRATTRIAVADVAGPAAERRVPVVQVEPTPDPVPGVDASALARAVRAHLAQVRACYERSLKHRPDVAGKLVLRFALTAAGTVSAVDVEEDTLHDLEVERCVRAAAATWRFPPPPRAVEVTFPFVFQPGAS